MINISLALKCIAEALKENMDYIICLENAVYYLNKEISKAKRIKKRTAFLASIEWKGRDK